MFTTKLNLILIIFIGYGSCQDIPELSLDFLPPFPATDEILTSNDINNEIKVSIADDLDTKLTTQSDSATSAKPTSITTERKSKTSSNLPPLVQRSAISAPAVRSADSTAQILKQVQNIESDGNYRFEYETDNGIHAEEQGSPKVTQTGEQSESVSGGYSYTAPDGQVISMTYLADENGFQPSGSHLPTPPPIPKAIQRALEYLKSQGNSEHRRK